MSRNETLSTSIAFIVATLAISVLVLILATVVQQLDQPAFPLIAVPVLTFAKIAPAFIFGGRIQPRNPLVVGFFAGFAAILLINGLHNQPHFEVYSLFGEALSAGLICSVSMFAGRQPPRLRKAT